MRLVGNAVIGEDGVRLADGGVVRYRRQKERVLAAAVQRRLLLVQAQIGQARQGVDFGDHPHVQRAVQHALLDVAGHHHGDVDAHAGAARAERLQRLGNMHVRLRDQVVDDADVEVATQLAVQLVHFVAEVLDGGQQDVGRTQHFAALVGQRKAGAATAAQAHAQPFFQVAHVQADGRAADAQHAFGSRETATLHHGLENAQQADVEIAHLPQRYRLAHYVNHPQTEVWKYCI